MKFSSSSWPTFILAVVGYVAIVVLFFSLGAGPEYGSADIHRPDQAAQKVFNHYQGTWSKHADPANASRDEKPLVPSEHISAVNKPSGDPGKGPFNGGPLKNALIVIVIGLSLDSRQLRWKTIRRTWAKNFCNVVIFAGRSATASVQQRTDGVMYAPEDSLSMVVRWALRWALRKTDSKWMLLVRDDSMVRVADVEDLLREQPAHSTLLGCVDSDGTPNDECGILMTRDVASAITEERNKCRPRSGKIFASHCIPLPKPRFIESPHFSNSKQGACENTSTIYVVGSSLTPADVQSCWFLTEQSSIRANAIYAWQISCLDILMEKTRWQSPIVVDHFKLIFFSIPKVACTQFKQLFRRMMGLADWRVANDDMPHDPVINGLQYIHHYSALRVMEMLSDPAWTKAVFFRDPYERLASAYLDKSRTDYLHRNCVFHHVDSGRHNLSTARGRNKESFVDFTTFVDSKCEDPHFSPQFKLIEPYYWSFMTFVGDFANLYEDTQRLLERIGAWEQFGKNGWGTSGNLSIFQENALTHRATDAHNKVRGMYDECGCKDKVTDLYKDDLYIMTRLMPPDWEPLF